jgi:hypothetical protein
MAPDPETAIEPPCAVPEKLIGRLLPVAVEATLPVKVAKVEPDGTVIEFGEKLTPEEDPGVITTGAVNPVARFTVTDTVLLPPANVIVVATVSENPATGAMLTVAVWVMPLATPVNVIAPAPVAVTVYCPVLPGVIVAGPVTLATLLDGVIVTGVVNVPTGVTETVTQLAHAPPPS